ncbi:hypothetical protein BDD12DRAFT_893960 [Trichophaea hybrida]|nr:hypothetical protein BDD12DRAFT_893960 [Trichophaea hybrida]
MFQRTYFPVPQRIFSSIRTLAVMLLLLSTLPMASSINVPPPLPEHEWVGKSKYNYTELHAHFADALVCLYVPVGVFGFYYWFIYVLIICYSLFDSDDKRDEMSPTFIKIIPGILTTIYSIFSLYQNIQTINDCSHITRYGAVRGVIILTLVEREMSF